MVEFVLQFRCVETAPLLVERMPVSSLIERGHPSCRPTVDQLLSFSAVDLRDCLEPRELRKVRDYCRSVINDRHAATGRVEACRASLEVLEDGGMSWLI